MNEREAHYILLIFGTFPQPYFWPEATEVDEKERLKIVARYEELKWNMLFSEALMIAKKEFMMRIAADGVPDGAGIPK